LRFVVISFTYFRHSGHLGVQALEAKAKSESESSDSSVAASASASVSGSEGTKDKRQVGSKETSLYPNHRSSEAATPLERSDDPEDGQETIYGTKPNQFIIRPIAPHQHAQHESHQEPQLRNFAAANSRPHAAQLLEQSQELQHYVYLQDIQRHQPKALTAASSSSQGKAAAVNREAQTKKSTPVAEEEQEQEAEQRYAVTIQQPQPQQLGLRGGPYAPYQLPLPLSAPQHQHQHQQQSQPPPNAQQQPQAAAQQPYQIIPEEQFLKLLEEELQVRAYHEQLRQQQQQQQPQQQHQPSPRGQPQPLAKPIAIHSTAATHKVLQQADPSLGLGGYRERERYVAEQQLVQPTYSRGGPKYLPHTQQQPQQQQEEDEAPALAPQHQRQLIAGLPPQIAYYQPQISYKTLPNHPLAKSSLESEIEKLLAANKPGPGQTLSYVDSSNEPTLVNHQHQHVTRLPPPPPQHPAAPTSHPALRQPKAYLASTPNSLLDANNQPFVPSLFKFSNFQQPTPIYPQPQPQQQQLEGGKRLGPVVYPTAAPAQPQPSQYYYQETAPTVATKPAKHYRTKHYKLPTPSPTKSYEKALLYADYAERAQPPAPAPTAAHFYPSPPDPIKHRPVVAPTSLPIDYPAQPAPSQSSIYVSQGTGIATPSRVTPTAAAVHHKLRTLDEVKQLNLPPPNGKPLTQAEFQALVEAGYPVKAVPVPVPVPYEQYVKEHPEYRNHPPVDYAHIMRLASRQLAAHQHQHQHQHQLPHQRSLASPSEPSVKIISSPTAAEAQQTAVGIGGGSVTYLQRRPRDEQDTAVAGSETKATEPKPTKAQ
ncbi:hypothetical protein KR215_007953, partial [Drosophila sulfurigaster]